MRLKLLPLFFCVPFCLFTEQKVLANTAAFGPSSKQAKSSETSAAGFKPNLAVHAYAAKKLGVPVERIEGGAIDERTAKGMPYSVRGAWAYTVWQNNPRREVRTWVTAEGIVSAPDQNIEVFFKEAGAWDKRPALTPQQIAEHLAWVFGSGYMVEVSPEAGRPAPRLEMKADAGTFRCFLSYRETGGGAMPGPPQFSEIVVTLTMDHHATLEKRS